MSLGRLIFFDQPGTGASDPVTPGALPTLEQWADSITAVLDDLGSSEAVLLAVAGALAPAALFAATYPSRTTALVVLEGPDPFSLPRHCGRRRQGRASKTRLNGVWVVLRNRVNPPSSTITFLNRCSPAWAPKAGPCRASDTGTQISDDAP